jgi:hypothetical protein
MNITGIPDSLDALDAFNRDYEQAHFAYHPNNRILADATEELFLSWFLPVNASWTPGLQTFGRDAVHCLMDGPMLAAFGYDPPPAWLKRTIERSLDLRRKLVRVLPARQSPYTLPPLRSYPDGYSLEQLGPDLSEPDAQPPHLG